MKQKAPFLSLEDRAQISVTKEVRAVIVTKLAKLARQRIATFLNSKVGSISAVKYLQGVGTAQVTEEGHKHL